MNPRSIIPLAGLCLLLAAGNALAWRWDPPRPGPARPDTAVTDPDARYIDFANGNDAADGTRQSPWKHHPWDANATGRSRRSQGIRTWIFKRGVTYRGLLTAASSGSVDDPMRLTSIPGWGEGPAVLSGADELTGGWSRCPANIRQRLPEASRTLAWCHPLEQAAAPQLLWEHTDTGVVRIPIARTPNWHAVDPDDPRSQWYELDDVVLELPVKVAGAGNFAPGDQLSVLRSGWHRRRPPRGPPPEIRVRQSDNGTLTLAVYHGYRGILHKGDRLIGPTGTAKVRSVGGTHAILRRLVDRKHLSGQEPARYLGAVVWSERASNPKPDAAVVERYDPDEGALTTNFHRALGQGPGPADRYFLEGLPAFLDTDGEYVYVAGKGHAGQLVLRLPGDRDPNTVRVEVADRPVILALHGQSNIEVSGLSFRYSNQVAPGSAEARQAALAASAILVDGNTDHVTIRDCDFTGVPEGIVAWSGVADHAVRLDHLVIDDNRFHAIDGAAIAVGNGQSDYRMRDSGSRLVHVQVLDNHTEDTGQRVLGNFSLGSQGQAIQVEGGEVVEVAGNDVRRSYGTGISVQLGADYEHGHVARPFLRSLVHHNRVVDTLLGAQDAGGIAAWMGGPAYIFDNESGNPVGCMYSHFRNSKRKNWYRNACYGAGIYLDGQYKGYVFNNIAWGRNNNVNDRIYNSVGFNEAMGFLHTVFQNTFYRFGVGLHKGMLQHNRDYYLGNLVVDAGLQQILQEPRPDTIEYGTLAFARNLFVGETPVFGTLGRPGKDRFGTLRQWQENLKDREVMVPGTGTVVPVTAAADTLDKDFRLVDPAPAIDRGVKVFVPWALSGVAGEWQFLRRQDAPETVSDESIWMDAQWKRREMFHEIPRNDLQCRGATRDDYRPGVLEDWVPGALDFTSGRVQCSAELPGKLDITGPHFLVEAVLRTDRGGAELLAKDDGRGYRLSIGPDGHPLFRLDDGNGTSQRSAAVAVTDGHWHHLLVDIDRSKPHGIDLYLDGKPANGDWTGAPLNTQPLDTSAPFRVGGSGASRFSGELDFLRVAQGNLADAETGIDELYAWEFNGPFLKDRNGIVAGARRDSGAVEY